MGGCPDSGASAEASLSPYRQRPRMGPGRTARRAAAPILEARSEPCLTMTPAQQSLPFRLAQASLALALRFWPEESRDWGHALAAELDEIEKPLETLRWALGGLMLFSRASASHFLTWLKLPAGSRLAAASLPLGTSPPVLPKRSRLFTAAILLATAVFSSFPRAARPSPPCAQVGMAIGDIRAMSALCEISPLAPKGRETRGR
jgi:hypothetical protein